MIAQYAQRNNLIYLSIDIYVQRGRFSDLAVSLANNLKQLPAVIPPQFGHLESLYYELICSVIHETFTIIDLENPFTWLPKMTLTETYVSHKDKEKTAAEETKKMRDKVIRIAENRFEAKVKARVLLMQAALFRTESSKPSAIRSPVSPSKRTASREHSNSVTRYGEERKKKHDQRRKEWNKILSIQRQANKLVDSYRKEYGLFKDPGNYEEED
jgi:hypothetical protein